jgi:hypothetical protein
VPRRAHQGPSCWPRPGALQSPAAPCCQKRVAECKLELATRLLLAHLTSARSRSMPNRTGTSTCANITQRQQRWGFKIETEHVHVAHPQDVDDDESATKPMLARSLPALSCTPPQTQRAPVRGTQTATMPHSSRIERHTVRGWGGEWPRIAPRSSCQRVWARSGPPIWALCRARAAAVWAQHTVAGRLGAATAPLPPGDGLRPGEGLALSAARRMRT